MGRRSSGMPTVKDIAASAKVSIGTVSRVLNRHADVDRQLKERVEAAVRKLGYRRTAKTRPGTQPVRPRIIGLVFCNNPRLSAMQSLLLLGIEELCASRGYYLLFARSECAPDIPAAKVPIPALITEAGVLDAVIVAGTIHQNFLDALGGQNLACVLLSNNIVKTRETTVPFSQARYNDLGGFYEATRYLVQLGHSDIWYIGDTSRPGHKNRYEGYVRAMADLGLPPRAHTVALSDDEFESGYAAISDILDQKLPITALLAGTNELAFGARESLRLHGLGVPKDVSLIGFEHHIGSLRSSNLTSVSVDIVEVGRQLAQLAISRVESGAGNGSIHEVVVPTRLVKRSSCRPLRREESMVL